MCSYELLQPQSPALAYHAPYLIHGTTSSC